MKRAFPLHSNAVWPSPVLLLAFVFAYTFLDASIWLIDQAVPGAYGVIANLREITNLRTWILAGAAGCYAVYRLCRFHPACSSGYASWLKMSPWTAAQPLPLGPVHPVWQDVAVVGVLAALAHWHAQIDPLIPVVVFCLVYLAGMTLLLAFTGQGQICVVLAFIWPTLILPRLKGLPMAGLVVALAVVVAYGYQRSLRMFPWKRAVTAGQSMWQIQIKLDQTGPVAQGSNAGWPFQPLSPGIAYRPVSARAAFVSALLIGWWTYCAIVGLQVPPLAEGIPVLALFAALLRLIRYCTGLTPPFNLLGRISSGRLIIPGFDRVFVVPLLVSAMAIIGAACVPTSSSWYPETEAVILAVLLFVLLAGGPRLQSWRLTGHHRYSPPRATCSTQSLRQV